MDKRTTFSDIEGSSRKRIAKRDAFLCEMDAAIPWDALVTHVKPGHLSSMEWKTALRPSLAKELRGPGGPSC